MFASICNAISYLPDGFSPDSVEQEGSLLVAPSLRLRNPLDGFLLELQWNRDNHLKSQNPDLDDNTLRHAVRECNHYTSNICVLLWFFHDYLDRCGRVQPHHEPNGHEQSEHLLDAQSYLLPIQVDKLLGDVRSFLDSAYRLARVFSSAEALSKLPQKKRFQESFGAFADRCEQSDPLPLVPPLTLLKELVPWGQTVRKMRDDYIH